MNTTAIFGAPGTGKTAHLTKMIADVSQTVPNMAVVSFTKAAAGVLTSRIKSQIRYVGTLHALAFKTLDLGKQQVADEKKFATWYGTNSDEVNVAMSVYNLMYHTGCSLPQAYSTLNPIIPFMRLEHLIESYKNWKDGYQYMDFNDMITEATNKVDKFDVVVVDEAQDLTDKQWGLVHSMLNTHGKLIIGGDDDQCQPPGTKVATNYGPTNVEELDPRRHLVLSYCSNKGSLTRERFNISSRPFAGTLKEVVVNGNITRYTGNHKCMVRFNVSREAVDTTRVVYLMQRGGMFRLGETKAFIMNRNGATFYPNNRMRQERAEKLWVLKATDSETESRQWEQLLSLKYGIPTIIFDYNGLRLKNKGNRGLMEFLHENLDITGNADRLLQSFGMSISHPTIIKKSGGQKNFECMAMNLQPKLMQMATLNPSGPPVWHDFTIKDVEYSGIVYSLDVSGSSKTYFADNIWTHNSIFTWAGANPYAMDQLATERVILEKSHRVPAVVHPLAQRTIRQVKARVDKEYTPTEIVGELRYAQYYEPLMCRENHTVLCRDKWALEAIEEVLIERGMAYTRNGMPSMYDRARCSLARAIELEDRPKIKRMAKYLKSQYREDIEGAIIAGWKKALDFGTWHKEANYLSLVDPMAEPAIHLSTIHGFKGEEADNIVLMADCTSTTEASMDSQVAYDNEVRVWYVGLTRCRKKLTIVGHNPFIGR